jgi:hypothetical protein
MALLNLSGSKLRSVSPCRDVSTVRTEGADMASIRAFMKPSDGAFDDHATRVMGEAFDQARK